MFVFIEYRFVKSMSMWSEACFYVSESQSIIDLFLIKASVISSNFL